MLPTCGCLGCITQNTRTNIRPARSCEHTALRMSCPRASSCTPRRQHHVRPRSRQGTFSSLHLCSFRTATKMCSTGRTRTPAMCDTEAMCALQAASAVPCAGPTTCAHTAGRAHHSSGTVCSSATAAMCSDGCAGAARAARPTNRGQPRPKHGYNSKVLHCHPPMTVGSSSRCRRLAGMMARPRATCARVRVHVRAGGRALCVCVRACVHTQLPSARMRPRYQTSTAVRAQNTSLLGL